MLFRSYGFGRVSKNPADNFKFRTPSLRNVAVTGPWGHNGAYRSLRAFVLHYANPVTAFDQWDLSEAILPPGYHLDQDLAGAWGDPAARA